MRVTVGIDTSCYTTSVALLDDAGRLVADVRRPLAVKEGGRGLAQSEMVYQHTRNLPEVFEAAVGKVSGPLEIMAVGAAAQPRPLPESFMPAFLVGAGYARVLAASHGAPFRPLSHQEGHILAGLWSAGGPETGSFLAVHVSGGTTEITRAVRTVRPNFTVTALGGAKDIAAGQLIDRIGVALGFAFPAGPSLEKLARYGRDNPAAIPVAVRDMTVSFAGPESHARRLLAKGESPAAIAAGIENCVADSLAQLVEAALTTVDAAQILFVGGVMANSHIRQRITGRLSQGRQVSLYFPEARYSGDNAVGAAYFALRF